MQTCVPHLLGIFDAAHYNSMQLLLLSLIWGWDLNGGGETSKPLTGISLLTPAVRCAGNALPSSERSHLVTGCLCSLSKPAQKPKKRWAVLVMGCTWVLPQFPACYLWFVVCTERDPHSVCPDVGVGAAFRGRLQRRLPAQSQAFRKLCLRYSLLLTYYKYNNKNNNKPNLFYRVSNVLQSHHEGQ